MSSMVQLKVDMCSATAEFMRQVARLPEEINDKQLLCGANISDMENAILCDLQRATSTTMKLVEYLNYSQGVDNEIS